MATKATMGNSVEACDLIRAVGLDPACVKRCIIDIDAEDVVRVYVEGYADIRRFEIQPPLPNIKARVFVTSPDGRSIDVTTAEDVASG